MHPQQTQAVEEVPALIPLGNALAVSKAARAAEARKKSGRRRGIDPTTCEREYSETELEFFAHVTRWRIQKGELPTPQAYLEIAHTLGYRLHEGELTVAVFQEAMRKYSLQSRRPFPTLSEVLEVLRDLGMQKRVASKA